MKKPDYTIPTKDGGPGQVTVEHERDLPLYITPTEAMLAFEAGWAAAPIHFFGDGPVLILMLFKETIRKFTGVSLISPKRAKILRARVCLAEDEHCSSRATSIA